MRIFPAIDLKGGKAVRLLQGRMEDATIYAENPVEVARDFKAQGADSLHVVDLDGAFAGQPVNDATIRQLIQSSGLKVQVGGGIRSLERIEELLNLGVERVILGTVAVREPELVQEAVARFGEAIVVGIDAKNGQVAVQGWAEKSEMMALELALKMKDVGVKHLVFTDISRDGMLQGPNIQSTVELARESGLQVVASGGVSNIEDIILLQKEVTLGASIEGVIIGKALYTGAITLSDALAVTASVCKLSGGEIDLEKDREGDGC
ncbi:MAG: 1-(5-phosphoribosyl)-5-[(5-phosphoribosylamino)methylideneamino]imidazole-4-carboxamide isomerase [Desulfitobacterium sp.]